MPMANLASIFPDLAMSTAPDTPPEPQSDDDLLVLAERALVMMRTVREQYNAIPNGNADAVRAHVKQLSETEHDTRALLRRASKLRAHTPPGLYAKARLVAGSRSGAAILAKSLAADMLAMPSLRRLIWPAEVA